MSDVAGNTMSLVAVVGTEDVGDGEIRIVSDRLQELILYTNNLENWFRDNGYTDK